MLSKVTCSVEGCAKFASKKGLCIMHNSRMLRNGSLERKPASKIIGVRSLKHGHTIGGPSPTYSTWVDMINRCTNPKASDYESYGGRGIGICQRWRESFGCFLQDMGERPESHTIDRYPNNDGDYEPGNCRWATRRQQGHNRRTSRQVIRSDGAVYKSMAEAAEAVGGSHKSIYSVCSGRSKTHRGFGWKYAT